MNVGHDNEDDDLVNFACKCGLGTFAGLLVLVLIYAILDMTGVV